MPALISVVVLSFRRPEQLSAALASIFAQEIPDLEVIVVDNCSDKSPQVAEEVARWPAARFLPQPTDIGRAAAVNLGIAASTGDYLHLTADEVILREGFYESILPEALHYPEALFSGILIERPGAHLLYAGAELEIGWAVRQRTLHEIPAGFGDSYATGMLPGSMVFGSRQAFSGLVGFRPEFFVGLEDADLCWRARRAGMMLRVVPAAKAWRFYEGAPAPDLDREYHALKNRFALAVLYAPLVSLPVHFARVVALSAPLKAVELRSLRLLLRVWFRVPTSLPGYLVKRFTEPKARRPE